MNRYHKLRPNDILNMQSDFIFFDTETQTKQYPDYQEQTLKLGWALYWNRITDYEEWFYFKNPIEFWNFLFNKIEEFNIKEIYIYAHNMDFDFKIVNGLKILLENKYILDKFYINSNIFSMSFKKHLSKSENKNKIFLYDTTNYVHAKLEDIGKSLGHEKLKIDFNTSKEDELNKYCKNDVMIIYLFIKKLIEFLNKYDLTKLRATSASIAMNTFRHKFYDYDYNPIFIHNNQSVIELERESYHGAISDCFKVGKFKGIFYKLDINSMYPYQMYKNEFPCKLFYYANKNIDVNNISRFINEYHIIANCKIELPKEFAYILTTFNDKCCFIYGELELTLTTPELNFVLKHGKILAVKEIALYKKIPMFKDYVNFFYQKRWEFKDESNTIFEQFCKIELNSLYGKFGQHESEYTVIKEDVEYDLGKYEVIENKDGIVKEYLILHIGNKIVKIENTENNAYDSFVAIASMVTAYARMYLIELILKAERKNIYYVDTDSLIINEEGYNNLKEFIDNRKLGYLKVEGITDSIEIIKPKWYRFGELIKCKGVKKNAEIISDDDNNMVIKQQQWQRFKTSLKEKNTSSQIITDITKVMSKNYDKGIVMPNGDVMPYCTKMCKI